VKRIHTWVAIAAACAATHAAHATTVTPATDGTWYAFDVDVAATGSPAWIDLLDFSDLGFAFTVPTGGQALVMVVDAGFAGDSFEVWNGMPGAGTLLSLTSAATNSYPNSVGLDFDTAFAGGQYSRAALTLGPGSYMITGRLATSALDDLGQPFDATVGGFSVTMVPEPAAPASLLAGLALLAVALRRRAR
jgi:PEP-CTERM motif